MYFLYWIDSPFKWQTENPRKTKPISQNLTQAVSYLPKCWVQSILAPKRLQACLEYLAKVANRQRKKC